MTHDISLDGNYYKIELSSYRVKDIIDFAPRASVPGGSVIMSDLGMYQPLVQTDFRRGFGFQWYDDASGYMSTSGEVDTRQEGLIMRYTQKTSSDTNNNAKEGFVNFNGALYSYGAGGLRKYNGSAWSSIYSTAAVNYALPAGDYLFFCPDGLRIQKMNTSDTVSDAGVDTNSIDYRWLVIHNGFIFAGKDGTNEVHYSDQEDLSDLEGTTSDPSIIYVGIGNVPTLGAFVYATNLYIARQDGLYHLGEDLIARRVINYYNEASSNNFRSMAELNGFMIYPIRDRLIQWNGVRVNDITPDKLNDSFPYTSYGLFDNFVSVDNFLYFTARTNETSYTESLICFDGAGFHKLSDLVSGSTTDSVTAMGYDVTNNRLWWHLDATNDVTYYIQMQNLSPFPYANFAATGTHSLYISRMDMGFRRVIKSLATMTVQAENLTSTRYISIYYQLDGDGTWVFWDDIVSNGVTELTAPGGAHSREFNFIQFRFDFITADSAQSPIMTDYTIRFIMRPNVLFGWNFNVISSTNARTDEMGEDERTASDIVKELREIRNSKSPVSFMDILGDEYTGYVTAVTESATYQKPSREGEDDEVEYRINVNFIAIE
jgi:hypothetical protein